MPVHNISLSQKDIQHIVAKHYGVAPNQVKLKINKGYDGPPTDSESPSVTATIEMSESQFEAQRSPNKIFSRM